MEWIMLAVGVLLAGAVGVWVVRRRRGDEPVSRHRVDHMGSSSTRGVEDSMTMRLPTGGNM